MSLGSLDVAGAGPVLVVVVVVAVDDVGFFPCGGLVVITIPISFSTVVILEVGLLAPLSWYLLSGCASRVCFDTNPLMCCKEVFLPHHHHHHHHSFPCPEQGHRAGHCL